MFKQEYQTANDRIHAGDGLLARIRDGQGRRSVSTRTVWWSVGGVAAAAVVLIAILAIPQGKSAAPTADAAAPMSAEGAPADEVSYGESAAASAEEPMMDMAVAEDAPAACNDAALRTGGNTPVWLYENCALPYAMDDWFVTLSEDRERIYAATRTDGNWHISDGLSLALPAEILLTDDDSVYAISMSVDQTTVTRYELDRETASSIRQHGSVTQAGAYLDALLENNVLYLLTQTDVGLCVGAANLSAAGEWIAEETLNVQADSARLYETNDGVLLACQTGDSCQLYVLLNEPNGFVIDGVGEQTGVLMYAYRTLDGTWHTIFDDEGMLSERILDDAFATVSEQVMHLTADMIFCDDEELIVCTYSSPDNMLLVEHYVTQRGGFYEYTGETWHTDAGALLGEIVSWDDDEDILYPLGEGHLYAFDVRACVAEPIFEIP